MIQVTITSPTTKGYLKDLPQLNYATVAEFIGALCHHNPGINPEADDEMFSIFSALGIQQLGEIPSDINRDLAKLYHRLKKTSELRADAERMAYQLLAAIQSGQLVLLVDGRAVGTLDQPIHLASHSMVTFYPISSGQNITFHTL